MENKFVINDTLFFLSLSIFILLISVLVFGNIVKNILKVRLISGKQEIKGNAYNRLIKFFFNYLPHIVVLLILLSQMSIKNDALYIELKLNGENFLYSLMLVTIMAEVIVLRYYIKIIQKTFYRY